MHLTPCDEGQHGARNTRTLLFGMIAYIFTAAFMFSPRYQTMISGVFFLAAIRDWFAWFVIADVLAMVIIYKNYWGKTILTEWNAMFGFRDKSENIEKPNMVASPYVTEAIEEAETIEEAEKAFKDTEVSNMVSEIPEFVEQKSEITEEVVFPENTQVSNMTLRSSE